MRETVAETLGYIIRVTICERRALFVRSAVQVRVRRSEREKSVIFSTKITHCRLFVLK